MDYLYTTKYGAAVKKQWEAAEKERGNPLPKGSGGGSGDGKLAGGGLIMGAVALAGLILVSSMGKKR